MYEKEFISLYISGISEKVKSISQFLFLIFNVQCIIRYIFVFELWKTLVADKTREMASTEIIYSNCLTS